MLLRHEEGEMSSDCDDSLLFLVRRGSDFIDYKESLEPRKLNGKNKDLYRRSVPKLSKNFPVTKEVYEERKRGRNLLSVALTKHCRTSKDFRNLTKAAWTRTDKAASTQAKKSNKQELNSGEVPKTLKPLLHMSVASGYFVERPQDSKPSKKEVVTRESVRTNSKNKPQSDGQTNILPRIISPKGASCLPRNAGKQRRRDETSIKSPYPRSRDFHPPILDAGLSQCDSTTTNVSLDLTIKSESPSLETFRKLTYNKYLDEHGRKSRTLLSAWEMSETERHRNLSTSPRSLFNVGLHTKDSSNSRDYLKCYLDNVDAKSDSYLLAPRSHSLMTPEVTKRSLSCVSLNDWDDDKPRHIHVFLPNL